MHQVLPTSRSWTWPAPGAGSEAGARARSRRSRSSRRLPPGRPFLRRAGASPPGGQRGPSPGRAGRAGPRGGAAAPSPDAASRAGLLRPALRYPPPGQSKFSGVPNFGRRCAGSCYHRPYLALTSIPWIDVRPHQRLQRPPVRLLAASPPPSPRAHRLWS